MKKPGKRGDKRAAVFVVNTGGSGADLVNKYLGKFHFRFAGAMDEADLIILSDGLTNATKVLADNHDKTVILTGGVARITTDEAIRTIRDEHFLDIHTEGGFDESAIVAYITYWLNKLAEG